MLTLRTIISTRATVCAVSYHDCFSCGCRGVTVSFSLSAESTLVIMRMLFSPLVLNFNGKRLPSSVRAVTISRFERLLWLMMRVESGMRVISCSKLLRFLGNSLRCCCAKVSLLSIF